MKENKLSKADKITIAIAGAATVVVTVGVLTLYNKYLNSCLDTLAVEADKLTDHILSQVSK